MSTGYQDLLLRARLPKLTNISGTVAVLGAARGDNYYHWLIDIVPRLCYLGAKVHEVDHIVVFSAHGFQRDCLEAAGVPMDRLIEPHRGMHLVADELLVPSLVPRSDRKSIAYTQELFRDYRSTAPPSRRLYPRVPTCGAGGSRTTMN